MIPCGGDLTVRQRTEGIKPSMNLYSSSMCLLDTICQWIITRRDPLSPADPVTPRLEPRLIDSISIRPYLKNDRIHFHRCHSVEHRFHFSLLGTRTHSFSRRPINIVNTSDPSRPKFSGYDWRDFLDCRILLGLRNPRKQKAQNYDSKGHTKSLSGERISQDKSPVDITPYPYRLIYLNKSELITFSMSQPWFTYFNSWVMHSNRSSGSWVI